MKKNKILGGILPFLLFASFAYAEEEIGLVQKIWRSWFKKPVIEKKAENAPSVMITKKEFPVAGEKTENLNPGEESPDQEEEGRTTEELYDEYTLKQELKHEKKERDLREDIKRAEETQRRPAQLPQIPR